jgi:hypothetical protein
MRIPMLTLWKRHSWPEGIDDEVLHINSLGGPRQVVWCHAKMSRLAQRTWWWGPALDLDQFLGWARTSHMLPCADVSVGLKEVTTHFYESSRCAKMTRLARRNSLGGPKQVVCCHVKMSRLAQRNSLGGPKQVTIKSAWFVYVFTSS